MGTSSSGSAPDIGLWRKGGRRERLQFRQAPLLAATIWFALGEVAARNWRPGAVLLLAILMLAGLCVWAVRGAMRVVLVPVAGLWMVVGMWCAQVRPAPSPQRALMGYADGLSREVRGHVVRVRALPPSVDSKDADSDGWRGDQDEEATAAGALQVDVEVEEVEHLTPDVSEMVPMEGGVRATLIADGTALPELGCGDEVQAPMRMREPERYRDPGAWQYADYLLSQGMAVHASLHGAKLRVTGHDSGTMTCRVLAAQSWAAGRVLKYVRSRPNRMLPRGVRLTADDAGMLNAMLFGDRTGLNHGLRLGFERTGSFHLFVVSGMHVALVAGGIFWFARRLRLREWASTLVTVGLTAAYAVLTGLGRRCSGLWG